MSMNFVVSFGPSSPPGSMQGKKDHKIIYLWEEPPWPLSLLPRVPELTMYTAYRYLSHCWPFYILKFCLTSAQIIWVFQRSLQLLPNKWPKTVWVVLFIKLSNDATSPRSVNVPTIHIYTLCTRTPAKLKLFWKLPRCHHATALPDKWFVYHLSCCSSAIIKSSFTATYPRSWKLEDTLKGAMQQLISTQLLPKHARCVPYG